MKEHVDSGPFELRGEMSVNVSGGLKSFGHPVGATGIWVVYELYKQMQGKVGGERKELFVLAIPMKWIPVGRAEVM